MLGVRHYTHRHSSGKRPWTQAAVSVRTSGSLFYLTHIVGKFLSSILSYESGRHVELPKPICRSEVLTCLLVMKSVVKHYGSRRTIASSPVCVGLVCELANLQDVS
jgi:hypothetical protein